MSKPEELKEQVISIDTGYTLGKISILSSSHKVVNEKGEEIHPKR